MTIVVSVASALSAASTSTSSSITAKRPHITVVGDLILDRYLIGDATKLNPEQPGVVIRVEKEEDRLGGAAAVAMIAAGFGAQVTLAGVVGSDEPGCRLQQLIVDHGIHDGKEVS